MKEKLKTAKKLRLQLLNSSKSYRKIILKIYLTYVKDCILSRKDEFELVFHGRHVYPISQRFINWIKYYIDVIHKFIIVNILHPNINNLSSHEYKLIYKEILAPVHQKISFVPDEYYLRSFLNKNNLEITDEFLLSTITIYKITKKKV